MDIQSAQKEFQNVTYDDDSFEQLVYYLSNEIDAGAYHLSLLVGPSDDPKKDAVDRISEKTGRSIYTIDANEIISKIESESFENIDYVFKKYDASEALLYLKNGTRLCGAYTGFTQSAVKYATPQERYFLKKIQQNGGLYIVDIDTPDDMGKTLRRAAQSIVHFPLPQSMFKKLLRKIKGVSVHGYEIKTERPKQYGGSANNF